MAASPGSLDANVLLRLLLNDVPNQHAAAEKLFQSKRGQFAVADTAIIEIAFVLERHYDFTRTQIVDAVGGLMMLSEIDCNRALFEKALSFFVQHRSLSFEDCCLVVYAELNSATPLWTFDQQLSKRSPSAELIPT